MDIGLRLRSLRESKGMTQEEVGKRIGVTKATVNRYETGEIDIKRTIAIKLADILDTTPSYIMGWDDEPGKIDKKSAPGYIDKTQADPDALAIKMYKNLDPDDKAEIRGEMKQMLKSDKYKEKSSLLSG